MWPHVYRSNVCGRTSTYNAKLRTVGAPTRGKRALGRKLRELRLDADVSSDDASREIKTADATLLRYETGHVLPAWGTVRTLLGLYQADPDAASEVERLFEAARDEPPPVRLPPDTPPPFRRLVAAERDADSVRLLASYTVPGLLQTERYTEALAKAAFRFHDPEARLGSVVTTRTRRQRRLEGADPLVIHALIDQAVILRQVGGASVMAEQLAHLVTLTERDSITIQVIPFAVGAYGTMSGDCIIVGYSEPETPGVYLEYPAGGSWVDDIEDVSRFIAMFDDVAALALSPDATRDLLNQRIRVVDSDD